MPTQVKAGQIRLATDSGLEDDNGDLKLGGNYNGNLALGSGSTLDIDTGATLNITDVNDTLAGGSPISDNNLATKGYVDAQVVQGKVWKEAVVSSDQLDSVNDALSQGILYFLNNQPTVGDLFNVTDGILNRSYGFGSGGDLTVTIGANPDVTMDNLVSVINGDGLGNWSAAKLTDLQTINSGTGTSTAGHVVLIYRTNQSSDTFEDRIYAVVTVSADHLYVNFAGEIDYTNTSVVEVPGADPLVKEFGFGRSTASLQNAETHLTLSGDSQYSWDADAGQWNQVGGGGGAVTGGDGIDVTASVVSVDLDPNSGMDFNLGQLRIPSSTGAAPVSVGVQNTSGNLVVQMGNGVQANGNLIEAKADTIGGPNLAASIDVNSNGLAIAVDDLTIVQDPFSNLLRTPTGFTYRETVLIGEQLDFSGVRQGIVFFLTGQPTAGDSFVITDGSTTRIYGFDAFFDGIITIGLNEDETMDNMAFTISSDFGGGLWDAVSTDQLGFFNFGTPTRVVVIYRRQQFISSYDDRLYGTGNYITSNFGNEVQYTSAGIEEFDYSFGFPATTQPFDPGVKTFGFGRDSGALVAASLYPAMAGSQLYMWDFNGNFFARIDVGGLPVGTGLRGGDGIDPLEIAYNPQEIPVGPIDGINANFDLASLPALMLNGKYAISLYKNGLLQIEGGADDYTVSGVTITFNGGSIPLGGDTLIANYYYLP